MWTELGFGRWGIPRDMDKKKGKYQDIYRDNQKLKICAIVLRETQCSLGSRDGILNEYIRNNESGVLTVSNYLKGKEKLNEVIVQDFLFICFTFIFNLADQKDEKFFYLYFSAKK